jgi:putative hydrolase of the HAD superfamily
MTSRPKLRALMVDVDGVLIVPRPGGWAADMEANLGLSPTALAEHFFAVHWTDVVLGRAGLHERLAPVLAKIAPHLTSEELAAYWFARDAVLDDVLLEDLAQIRAQGIELHLATVQEHLRAEHLWNTLGFRRRFDAMHYAADLGCGKAGRGLFRRRPGAHGLRARGDADDRRQGREHRGRPRRRLARPALDRRAPPAGPSRPLSLFRH